MGPFVTCLIYLSICLSSGLYSSDSNRVNLKVHPAPVAVPLVINQADADLILGTWLSEHADGKVLITKSKGRYYGSLSWIKRRNADGSPVLDVKNPDPALQKENVAGLEILKGFLYSGDRTWEGGTIYDPLSGKTYSSKITTETADKIKIRGFIGITLFGRTTVWTRSK